MCAKDFLQIYLFGEIIGRIVYLLCRHRHYHHIGAYTTLPYSKTCISQKQHFRIDWKIGRKLILSISTELCHKNIMLELQNGSSRCVGQVDVNILNQFGSKLVKIKKSWSRAVKACMFMTELSIHQILSDQRIVSCLLNSSKAMGQTQCNYINV